MTLFVDCCPRSESRTRRLAAALLQKLGDYEELRLCDLNLRPLDEKGLQERTALQQRGELQHPSFALARQFAAAERIVIAAPFWDLSFPSMLKLYLETIYIVGIISAYDANGRPKGLCKGRELYYVTTAGGPYDGRYSFEYLKTLCTDYLGIPKVTLVKADMLDIAGNDAEAIVRSEIEHLNF